MEHFNKESKQTEIYNKYGAFFAFNDKQFYEKSVEGVEYVNGVYGIIVPKENHDNLYNELKNLFDQKIKYELENNSIKDIIWYELDNHEAQMSGDISSTFDAVEQYGITLEQVKSEYGVYFQHCIDNDYF